MTSALQLNKMDPLYVHRQIRTVSGKYVDVFEPDLDTLIIEDIAHALSMQPRYGGHSPVFYSVAQHCIWIVHSMLSMGEYTPAEIYTALMHDASEAYLIDMPKPIKLELPDYNRVEDVLMTWLAKKFKFEYPLPPIVKDWDRYALEFEWTNIVCADVPIRIELSQEEAKKEFLRLFKLLQPK